MEHMSYGQEDDASHDVRPERPPLDIDLQGPNGNVFMVIGMARRVVKGDDLKDFNRVVWEATQLGSGKTYQDILGIVNDYADLLDTSNTYPKYGPQAHIEGAVEQLNNRLRSLKGVESEITGLYPEFDDPNLGPDKYVLLVEEEIERVEAELLRCGDEQREELRRMRAALLACSSALRRAGADRWDI